MGATEDKTRPISFRVDVGVLDALTRAGLSATEIARAALEKEARRARAMAALEDLAANPAKVGLGEDVVEFLRRDRDSHV